jgi:hypothetical protein
LVTIASGKLRRTPKAKPINQPGHDNWTRGITKPIPNLLQKAASNAVRLSGNDIGNIKATSTAPKINPHNKPVTRRDTAGIR